MVKAQSMTHFTNRAGGAIDVTGHQFGNWLVEHRGGTYGKDQTWWCRCVSCGNRKLLTKTALLRARKREQTAYGECSKTAAKAAAE